MSMNLTLKELNPQTDNTLPYQATQDCANWCVEQQIVYYNNLELGVIAFVLLSLIMILIGEFCQEHKRLRKYSWYFIYCSKIAIYIL